MQSLPKRACGAGDVAEWPHVAISRSMLREVGVRGYRPVVKAFPNLLPGKDLNASSWDVTGWHFLCSPRMGLRWAPTVGTQSVFPWRDGEAHRDDGLDYKGEWGS